ncbi:MAG: histidine kinase [Vicinamibacterales bacterium]
MPARRLSLLLLFGIATAFGLSSTIQSYLLSLSSDEQMGGMVGHLLILNLVYWYVPALFAPVIVLLARRFQFARGQGWRPFAVHITGALTYSVLHSAAMLATRMLLMHQHRPARGWFYAARIEYLTQLDWVLMTYLFLVGIGHALAYRRESERRALDSAHLETRLVEAQLQSLQRQLQPHFLFNTLNAISGLMRTDVDAADRMMDRLGGLLRMTLDSSNVQEVPLKDELEMLQKSVDIEQVRFGPRLQVTQRIAPETLAALVPNFLLQPLVENAVRHGIAPHTRQGRIRHRGAARRRAPRPADHRQRRRRRSVVSHADEPGGRALEHTGAARAPLSRRTHLRVLQRQPASRSPLPSRSPRMRAWSWNRSRQVRHEPEDPDPRRRR